MKINWHNVLERVIGGVLTAAVLALISWLWLSLSKSRIDRYIAILIVIFALIIGLALFVEPIRHIFGRLGAMILSNTKRVLKYWRWILAFAALIGICILVFLIFGDLRVVGLLIAYTSFLIFLFMIWTQSQTTDARQSHEISYQTLPLDQIANSEIGNRYRNFSIGETHLGGVPFYIKAGRSIFDTSASSPEDTGSVELRLTEPLKQIKTLCLLINAGGAWKRDKNSGKSLEGKKIGDIQLAFADGSLQWLKIILGVTIREWAPGNFPGELIDTVSDPDQLCTEVWRGKNDAGNDAVIDMIEVPIAWRNRNRALEKIVIFHEKKRSVPHSKGVNVDFFILGITLKIKER